MCSKSDSEIPSSLEFNLISGRWKSRGWIKAFYLEREIHLGSVSRKPARGRGIHTVFEGKLFSVEWEGERGPDFGETLEKRKVSMMIKADAFPSTFQHLSSSLPSVPLSSQFLGDFSGI